MVTIKFGQPNLHADSGDRVQTAFLGNKIKLLSPRPEKYRQLALHVHSRKHDRYLAV